MRDITELFYLYSTACFYVKPQSDSRGRLSLQLENERLFSLAQKKHRLPPYEIKLLAYNPDDFILFSKPYLLILYTYSDSRGRLSLQEPSPSRQAVPPLPKGEALKGAGSGEGKSPYRMNGRPQVSPTG